MIQSYGLSLLAGVPNRVVSAGAYFRLMAGTGVDIVFLRRGAQIGQALNQNTGFYVRSREGSEFDEVQFISATPQNVNFLIGEDEAGAADSVSVSGTVNTLTAAAPGTFVVNGVSIVGTANTAVLGAQARRYLFLQNLNAVGGGVIHVQIDNAASLSNGYRLAPGDSLTFDGLWVPQVAVNAIATVAGSSLSYCVGN